LLHLDLLEDLLLLYLLFSFLLYQIADEEVDLIEKVQLLILLRLLLIICSIDSTLEFFSEGVVPDIVCGNSLSKALIHFSECQAGGVIVGARVPIILLSRASGTSDKLNSICLGALND